MSDTFNKIDTSTIDFSEAPSFRKTAKLNSDNIEVCQEEREVVTIIDDKEETLNIAKEGDRIVTGPKGEEYVIDGSKFEKLYEPDPNNPEEFRAKGTVQAVHLTENVTFTAPWGEEMQIEAGGVLVKNGDDIYGIEEGAFSETYGRSDKEGNVFACLDEPSREQRYKAAEREELEHVADIEARHAFNKFREAEFEHSPTVSHSLDEDSYLER